jgi:hypothetical protein
VYEFALQKEEGNVVAAAPLTIDGPTVLSSELADRSSTRTAGAIVGIGGIVTGIVLIAVGVGHQDDSSGTGLLGGGIGLVVTSAVVGSILGLQHDEARIVATPAP